MRTSGKFDSETEVFSGRTIDVPSCFISGKSDWGVYRCHLVEGAGHWVQQEQPEAVSRLLLEFLEGARPRPISLWLSDSSAKLPSRLVAWASAALRSEGFRFALSDEQGAETVRAGYDAGLRYFDTSPYYGYGRSELLYGYALRSRPRDSFVLSTKVGRWMTPLGEGERSRAGVRAACRSRRPSTTAAMARCDPWSSRCCGLAWRRSMSR